MKNSNLKSLYIGVSFLVTFIIWTILILIIDVKPIGPNDSCVGFSSINKYFHNLTGVHLSLYNITDWLSLIPFVIIGGFSILGLVQWIKSKKLIKVDFNLLLLGAFYIVVLTVYVLFEYLNINYRPILINGVLEASYPSSTTMLTLCVMPTTVLQFKKMIKNRNLKIFVNFTIVIFSALMVLARLLSGVHWFTDIFGGILLSIGLVNIYIYSSNCSFK